MPCNVWHAILHGFVLSTLELVDEAAHVKVYTLMLPSPPPTMPTSVPLIHNNATLSPSYRFRVGLATIENSIGSSEEEGQL